MGNTDVRTTKNRGGTVEQPGPISGKLFRGIMELRSFTRPLSDEDFQRLRRVVHLLEDCAERVEAIERRVPLSLCRGEG